MSTASHAVGFPSASTALTLMVCPTVAPVTLREMSVPLGMPMSCKASYTAFAVGTFSFVDSAFTSVVKLTLFIFNKIDSKISLYSSSMCELVSSPLFIEALATVVFHSLSMTPFSFTCLAQNINKQTPLPTVTLPFNFQVNVMLSPSAKTSSIKYESR